MKNDKFNLTYKVNTEIKADKVRIVNDTEGIEKGGIYDLKRAIDIASHYDKDLICINNHTTPMLCVIEKYDKYLFDAKKNFRKKIKEQKSKRTQKEIRLSLNIQINDIEHKLNSARKFLNKKQDVVVGLFLKGRQRAFVEDAQTILTDFIDKVSDIGESRKIEVKSNRLTVVIKPVKK